MRHKPAQGGRVVQFWGVVIDAARKNLLRPSHGLRPLRFDQRGVTYDGAARAHQTRRCNRAYP